MSLINLIVEVPPTELSLIKEINKAEKESTGTGLHCSRSTNKHGVKKFPTW